MRARREQHPHPFDEERAGSRLTLRVAMRAEPAPTSGPLDPPFRWDDVLAGPPPGERERGPPRWCLLAPEVLAADVRIENALLVSQREDGGIEVEDRLALTQRAAAPMIRTERALVGVRLEEAKAAAHARADEAPHPVETAVHRAWAKLLGGTRSVTHTLATIPDRVTSRARRAYAFLSTPDGRARFRHGLFDPHDLTPEQKGVTLFVGVSAILGLLVLSHFVVTLAAPDLARPWRTLFFLFLYGFVTSVGVPLPIEPVLLPAALAIGPTLAVGATLLAKVLAAWMVFFLGDAVNDRLRRRAQRSPRMARFLDASETFARRFGMWAVAAFIATPGLPDAIALYIFGSLHMRLWKFLLGVAVGGAILYTAVTLGAIHLLGL